MMKKLLITISTFCLLFTLAACGQAKGTAEPNVETWYGQIGNSELCLNLSDNGKYTLTLAGKEKTGTWKTNGSDIYLDGEDSPSLVRLSGALSFPEANIVLQSQKSEIGPYAPSDLANNIPVYAMNGYWKSLYVKSDGVVVFADDIGECTDLYIEAPKAALGGPLFGDVLVEMTDKDGALTYSKDGTTVTLALQEDGLLRMTLSTKEGESTLYCVRIATM